MRVLNVTGQLLVTYFSKYHFVIRCFLLYASDVNGLKKIVRLTFIASQNSLAQQLEMKIGIPSNPETSKDIHH